MINADLGLLTDLYQISMSYAYWKNNMAERKSVFNLYFRKAPYGNQYAIACGLGQVVKYIEGQREFWLSSSDMNYLWTLTGDDGNKLFSREFIDFLGAMEFDLTIDAIPEGTVVFPGEPLLRVFGPLYQCQLLESILLNQINFSTLIATKAHRIVQAAGDDQVFDFGLRRAQGIDGALSASRAAYIGGCAGTSNVLAGRKFGIPVKGTMAHSFIMSFDNELDAMIAWVNSMPNNSTLLVDTYDTIRGIDYAITAGNILRKNGKDLAGIRLDSGDLCELSKQARKMLDAAGFTNTTIVASNDLDEIEIMNLKAAGACVNAWGVGTNLITGGDQSALGGVYKLSAIESKDGQLRDKIKVSADVDKSTYPGLQKVRRYFEDGKAAYDIIYDERRNTRKDIYLPSYQDLLVPVYDNGVLIYKQPELKDMRQNTFKSVKQFDWQKTPHYGVLYDEKIMNSRHKLMDELHSKGITNE